MYIKNFNDIEIVETGLNTFLYPNRSSFITLSMWSPTWEVFPLE